MFIVRQFKTSYRFIKLTDIRVSSFRVGLKYHGSPHASQQYRLDHPLTLKWGKTYFEVGPSVLDEVLDNRLPSWSQMHCLAKDCSSSYDH